MRASVILSDDHFIAEGTDRKCYRHPRFPDRCIKVLHPHRHRRRSYREIRYFRRLCRRDIEWQRLTRYHGQVETNLGRGGVFELVADHNGEVSKSLEYYLQREDAAFLQWASEDLNTLTRELYDQWVVFHDLNPSNIVVRRTAPGEQRLVVIDGIGHNQFLPVANYLPAYARRKIVRVWNRRHRQWYAPYPAMLERLEAYA